MVISCASCSGELPVGTKPVVGAFGAGRDHHHDDDGGDRHHDGRYRGNDDVPPLAATTATPGVPGRRLPDDR